ncbi:malto-oligosyltrehalose trehalohydrolase (plasmid) [Rhizobium etli 8C-3]|uniref:Malto-oligosyltrehalose trehalohydrolase n=1 Tax=Rhizobium etli 8C-3 TaxID=538025 RepID=A0A1L5PGP1_RHIET|nr:malto-oligosyltrehalose trehalohydrolase [Rhizobium etli]APO79106.1 malto-oligosyltrehalose trehalohydrolase [Rhizobium etli 8C-3]
MHQVSKAGSVAEGEKGWGPTIRANCVDFRIWAPGQREMALRCGGKDRLMNRSAGGWFELTVPEAKVGDAYAFVLGDGGVVPDPASREQAGDVHGPSLIVEPSYQWLNDDWKGRPWEEAVISEVHIGAFTGEGTFKAAAEKLGHLAKLGFTAIEVMPVAQFSGKRGWGYDGVLHYAPHSAYGTPADFKAFIDAAHGHGLMVLLDVVYNHFGPDGNYLHRYAPEFFRFDRNTPWGAAIDFGQEPVRRYFVENALYWIGEFRLDGLRLDAVEQIYDTSKQHILEQLSAEVGNAFADRAVHLVVEDQRNLVSLLERDGDGRVKTFTAEWNDDFHHVAHIIATGETEGHYRPFASNLWEKTKLAMQHGFVFPDRGTPPEVPKGERVYLPPQAFINFLQNHDQVGNRAFGERLVSIARPDMVEMLAAILILSPQVPFLFMGDEYGETQPFFFFSDYAGELGEIVRKGRAAEAEGFGGLKRGKTPDDLPNPNAVSTFACSKLQWQRCDSDEGIGQKTYLSQLIDLRHNYVVPLLKKPERVASAALESVDGALAIDWTFGTSKLELRANLADTPLAVPAFDGAVIFDRLGSHLVQPGDGKLAAGSVVFAIDPRLIK